MAPDNGNKKIYFMGIGGIAMGSLATMLKESGYEVTGSDQGLYPPMSLHLEALKVPVHIGYKAENVTASAPDMVVVGNVIRRDNPEARYVLESGIPYVSMPQAISRFFLESRKSIVIAGTHGKSTTSSLLAWILAHAGLEPTAFIGAFLKNWDRSHRLGSGKFMVLEGDEYDTAFFDKGPKFLHYRPHIGVITSIEFDHADIFKALVAVLIAYLVVRRSSVLSHSVDTISMMPYIMPGAVIGIALIIAFSGKYFSLTGTLAIMVIALAIRRMPYTSRSATATIMQIPISTEEAAISLGSSKLKTFAFITVPQMSRGIISGAILSFVSIITEMSSGIFLYNNRTITLTLSTYSAITLGSYGTASAFATVTTLFTVICLVLYLVFSRGSERVQV